MQKKKRGPKKPHKGQFQSDDPRRHTAPVGNQYALRNRSNGRGDFISQQLRLKLGDKVPANVRKKAKLSQADMTYYEALVIKLLDETLTAMIVLLGNYDFIFNRAERLLTRKVQADVNVHALEKAMPLLTDHELDVMEAVSKKMLQLEHRVDNAKVIDVTPT